LSSIAEGRASDGAQVPRVVDAFDIPRFRSLTSRHAQVSLHAARHEQLRWFNLRQTSIKFVGALLFVAGGGGFEQGISSASVVHDKIELFERCRQLLASFQQPVLVETFLPGREFTVGIVGTGAKAKALGSMEVSLDAGADAEVYSYANKVHYESRVRYQLIEGDLAIQTADVALQVWRRLCRAGIDLRSGRQFLEIGSDHPICRSSVRCWILP
jgi:hypothetical protein